MKILHIVGNEIEPSNGIGKLIPEMIEKVNLYSDILDCSMLCLNGDYTSKEFKVFSEEDVSDSLFDSYDVFVFHGVYFLKYIGLYKKILSLGKVYLVKPHSSLIYQAQKKSLIKKVIANSIFFKSFIKNAAAVIFTNEDEASNSVCWNKRVIFEGNGITSTQIDTVYQDKPISSKPYKFVYLARIDSSHKGTDILLDALFVLKNSKGIVDLDFTFYGKGDVQEELLLQKRISELNFASVSFKGPIYGDEKIKMLNSKDVFVLTSRYEGFPMAVLEALDCGLPCLVTQGVNMSKIIGKYNVGWECQTNVNDVAELLLEVINTEPLHLRDMSIAARQFVADNHSWPSLVKQTEAMFLGVNERTT